MLVTINEFNVYSGNNETTKPEVALKTSMLQSAEQIVVDYLGYHPTIANRTDILSGIGYERIYTHARNIQSVTTLQIDGQTINALDYAVFDDYIKYSEVFPRGQNNVRVVYSAGFNPDSNEMALIKSSIMRIASLMLQEANGNIGLTGKSFADQSRTFVSYANYDKYLQPLNHLCCVRFD